MDNEVELVKQLKKLQAEADRRELERQKQRVAELKEEGIEAGIADIEVRELLIAQSKEILGMIAGLPVEG